MAHSQTCIAWAAGFFDGEGCIATDGKTNIRLEVSNCDPRPVKRMHAMFGGRFTSRERSGNHETIFEWIIGSKTNVKLVLLCLLPYLISKHEEAELVISLIDSRKPWAKRYNKIAYQAELRRLSALKHNKASLCNEADALRGLN